MEHRILRQIKKRKSIDSLKLYTFSLALCKRTPLTPGEQIKDASSK